MRTLSRRSLMQLLALSPVLLATRAGAQADMVDPFKGALPDTGGVDYELGPNLDPRVIDITKDLGCICGTCPHEPISTCTCGTARRIRAHAALAIHQGKDKDGVVAALVEKFGDTILPKPPLTGLNLLAYFTPFVGIVVAAVWVRMFALEKWRKNAAQAPTLPLPAAGAPADPYLAAVDAEFSRREKL